MLKLTPDARGTKITWLSAPSPTGVPSINFVTGTSIPADSQIWNNYGPKPNEELLHGYGFVLPQNPDDTLGLKLGGVAPPDVLKKLEAEGLDMGRRVVVGTDGELPQDLLRLVRILLGGGAAPKDTQSEDEEDDHAAHQHAEEELELEAEVLSMLGEMLEGKLRAIGEVQTEGCRPEVVEMCRVYRDGELL